MKEENIYPAAVEYLLSLDGVTPKMIDHETSWIPEEKQPNDMPELYKAFLEHAKNRRNMPKTIGELGKLKEILCDFDHQKVLQSYSSWENIFKTIKKQYDKEDKMKIDNPKSLWVIYCKSIFSVSKFLSQYKDIDAFLKFADSFDIDNHHRRLLPLYIQAEITGYGFALACDLIKNYINPNYVKPDVHINKISKKLGITDAKSKDYQIFKDVIDYCDRQCSSLPFCLNHLSTITKPLPIPYIPHLASFKSRFLSKPYRKLFLCRLVSGPTNDIGVPFVTGFFWIDQKVFLTRDGNTCNIRSSQQGTTFQC